MDALRVDGEDRADLAHAITHRDNGVKMLVTKLVEVLGMRPPHLDAEVLHRTLGQGMNPFCWITSGALGFDVTMAQLPEQRFGHLRTGAVMGAEKQDPQGHLWWRA